MQGRLGRCRGGRAGAAGGWAGAGEVGQVQQEVCHAAGPQGLVKGTPSLFTLDLRACAGTADAFSQPILGLFCSI